MKDGKYAVMIVEDQQMPKMLFSQFVSSSDHFTLVCAIENAALAEVICLRHPVDLILMDVVTENGVSGLDAAARIREKFPQIRIIIVTSMPEYSYLRRAREIGVEGFWYKETDEEPILSLMERVMAGERVYPDAPRPVRMGLAVSSDFTEKELEILRYMTGGFSNQEIAEKTGVSAGVVKNHVADMLSKTGFRSRTQLAVRARESGLVILDRTDGEL